MVGKYKFYRNQRSSHFCQFVQHLYRSKIFAVNVLRLLLEEKLTQLTPTPTENFRGRYTCNTSIFIPVLHLTDRGEVCYNIFCIIVESDRVRSCASIGKEHVHTGNGKFL